MPLPFGKQKTAPIGGPTVIARSRTAGLKEFEGRAMSAFCRRHYDHAENWRIQYYPTWYQIIAFLQGEHYAQYANDIGYWEPEKATQETYRATINYITGAHQNLIAKTTKNRPRVSFVPVGSGHLRQDATRFMRQLDDHLHYSLDRDATFQQALAWAYALGMGFDKSFWDPYDGDTILTKKKGQTDDPETTEYFQDMETVGMPVFQRQMTGEISHSARGLFEIGFDPLVQSFYDSDYVYEQQTWRVHEFRERFPDTFHQVKPDTGVDTSPGEFYRFQLLQNLQGLSNYSSFGSAGITGGHQLRNFARCVEFYFKPRDIWPEGALVHWTPDAASEDGILNVQPLPFSIDDPRTGYRKLFQWHPYSMFVDIPVPGKPLAQSRVQHAISVQQMINREVSSIQEFINMAAKYRILVQEGHAEIDRDEFQDHHMNFVGVKGDPKAVTVMPTAEMSGEVREMRNWLENAFDKIFGQTLEEEGKAVRSGLSGDAIEYLDALQQVRMLPNISMFVRALCRTARLHLLLAKKHYSEDPLNDRLVSISGRGGSYRSRIFDDQLIAIDFTTRCEGISELSRSIAARKAEVLKYYNAGAFGPVQSPQAAYKMLRLSEFGNVEEIYSEIAVTENLVHTRLDAILDNLSAPDDGPWHFEEHEQSLELVNAFRRSNYGELNQTQRRRVDYYATMHQAFQAQAQLAQAGEQDMMSGASEMEAEEDATEIEEGGTDQPVDMNTQQAVESEQKYAKGGGQGRIRDGG